MEATPLSEREEVVKREYASSLEDLTLNSKPLINMLTMLAEENRSNARAIVLAIELHMRKVPSEVKLPVLYLIDSIIKNVGSPYSTLFNNNIVQMFCSVFEKGDEKTRLQLFKLRNTWNQMLPAPKLYALDVHAQNFDPAWPVQPLPTIIHVNPKFLNQPATTTTPTTTTTATAATATALPPTTKMAASGVAPSGAVVAASVVEGTGDGGASLSKAALQENLRRKEKKLLYLKQKKLELELMQTKKKLREQELLSSKLKSDSQSQSQPITTTTTTATTTATTTKRSERGKEKKSKVKEMQEEKEREAEKLAKEREKEMEREFERRASSRNQLTRKLKQELDAAKQLAATKLSAANEAQPPPTSVGGHHTTLSSSTSSSAMASALAAKSAAAAAAVNAASAANSAANAGTGPAMVRIAPVSSQLLSAVQRRATRDPRLLRGSAAPTGSSDVISSSVSAMKTATAKPTVQVHPLPSLLTSTTTTTNSTAPTATTKSAVVKAATPPPKSAVVVSGSKSSSPSSSSQRSSSSKSSSSYSSSRSTDSKKHHHHSHHGHHHHHHSNHHHHQSSQKELTTAAETDRTVVAASPLKIITDLVTEKAGLDLDRSKQQPELAAVQSAPASAPNNQAPEVPPANDVDLRLAPPMSALATPTPMTSSSKRLSEERELSSTPPQKKTKVMERFDELFGGESATDKDARAASAGVNASVALQQQNDQCDKSPDASVAHAPLTEMDENREVGRDENRWSNYKTARVRDKDREQPYARRTNKDTDRLGRPLLYRHGKEYSSSSKRNRHSHPNRSRQMAADDGDSSSGSPQLESDSPPLSPSHPLLPPSNSSSSSHPAAATATAAKYTTILKQAEEDMNLGNLTSSHYNHIIKEVIAMNEQKQLDEARRQEERENRKERKAKRATRFSDSVSDSATPSLPPPPSPFNSLEPIADEDLPTTAAPTTEIREKERDKQREKQVVNGDVSEVVDMDVCEDDDEEQQNLHANRREKEGEDASCVQPQNSIEMAANDGGNKMELVYEPLLPPPMPPVFMPRRSSSASEEQTGGEDEGGAEREEGLKRRKKKKKELVEEEAVEEAKLPIPQAHPTGDVDNRIGFPPLPNMLGLATAAAAAASPPHQQLEMAASFLPPPVMNSTKDTDLRRFGPMPLDPLDHRPPVDKVVAAQPAFLKQPLPAVTAAVHEECVPSVSVVAPSVEGGPPPPWAAAAPWMAGMPPVAMQCWGTAPQPPHVLPLRPPPIPPPVMFEQDGSSRLCELPAADVGVLEAIAADTMRSIEIDGTARDIRYYGDTAVVFLSWNDPRLIHFQASSKPRQLIVDDRPVATLHFNAPYQEVLIDGHTYPVRLGGPTRELYVGGSFYQVHFGGPPVSVRLRDGGVPVRVQLEGPPPQVSIGRARRDLCLGKCQLIVDARHHYTLFLDPKAQRFELDGRPHIIRFVEALETTVINGVPFKFEFGGLPRPVLSCGKKHYLRLSSLPAGVVPGYVDILGMEGGRRGPPPPLATSPPPTLHSGSPPRQDFLHDERSMPMMEPTSDAAIMEPLPNQFRSSGVKNPLDVLSTMIAPAAATPPVSGFSYAVEKDTSTYHQPPSGKTSSKQQQQVQSKQQTSSSGGGGSALGSLLGEINIQELFEKLVATGIVPTSSSTSSSATTTNTGTGAHAPSATAAADQSERSTNDQSERSSELQTTTTTTSAVAADEDAAAIEFVDFGKPQTLKTRQPGWVKRLYAGIQCSSCGVRFAAEQTLKYSQHLDWHFRQNRRERHSARLVQSRTWYYDLSDWTQYEEIEDIEQRAQSWFDTQALEGGEGGEGGGEGGDEDGVGGGGGGAGLVPSVACESGEVEVRCTLCQDKFDIFYNEEKEEWHLNRAVKVDDHYYHPLCYDDYLASLKTPPPEPEPEPTNQEPIASITIDEDDSDETKNKTEDKGEEEEEEDKKKKLTEGEKEGDEVVEKELGEEDDDDDDDVIIQEPENRMEIIELLKDDDEEEEEQRKKRDREREEAAVLAVGGTDEESCNTKMSAKDSQDGTCQDPTSRPTDFQAILKNIKKEKLEREEATETMDLDADEEETIDLEKSGRNGREEEEEEEVAPPPTVVDTTQVKVACSIDGNVEMADGGATTLLAAPSRIKINISKAVPVSSASAASSSSATTAASDAAASADASQSTTTTTTAEDSSELQRPTAPVDAAFPLVDCVPHASLPLVDTAHAPLALVESAQPPPPGEEPGPLALKPRLIGHKLNELPAVCRGTELSGLCSIM